MVVVTTGIPLRHGVAMPDQRIARGGMDEHAATITRAMTNRMHG
jgi:hypothetical protein